MLNVVLVEPQIPANTGNIGRTCVLAGARLHLVGPLGFELTSKALQRAGLAYWDSLDVATYASWDEFEGKNLTCAWDGVHLLTKAGERTYAETHYGPNDWLVFGKESSGLDLTLLRAHADLCERIPMRTDASLKNADAWHKSHSTLHPELRRDICGNYVDEREGVISSLNLSNAVAIAAYEALRQQGFSGLE